MTDALVTTVLRRQPLDVLLRPADRADGDPPNFDLSAPIDRSRWFVCPTLTPLYYTRVYHDMREDQQRRYNQLTALCFNELIAFFETAFASSVLATLAEARHRRIDQELADCLAGFIAEERQHNRWWRQLNLLSEPQLYTHSDQYIIRLPAFAQRLLGFLTARPRLFPVVFWVMLLLEERSLDVSRRCLHMDRDTIEPRYRAVYHSHLKDEVRHVQIDWHLIDRFFANRSLALRKINAKLFALMVGRFFLPPTRSAVRVVRRLVSERQELAPLESVMLRQLTELGDNLAYHEMMYSRMGTPITFALFDRFEEMHAMRYVVRSYHPNRGGSADG